MKSSHAFKKTDPFSVEPASTPMMMMGKSSSLSGGVKDVRGRKAGPDSLVSSSNAQKCLMSSTTKFDKNVYNVPKPGAELTIGYL